MRIISGALGGRRLAGPKDIGTRPTSERVREAIMSALSARRAIEGAEVLDLFAGTGAMALESISRGARSAVVVDRSRRALQSLTENAEALGIRPRIRAARLDLSQRPQAIAKKLASLGPFDLVFADPPYEHVDLVGPLIEALCSSSALRENAIIVVEHATRHLPRRIQGLLRLADYRFGDTSVLMMIHGLDR